MGVFQQEGGIREKWKAMLAVEAEDSDSTGDQHIRMVNSLLRAAVRAGASDIHIEPWRREAYRVRLRTDGLLGDFMVLDRHQYEGVVGRLRVLGQMDIAENRAPADGSFSRAIDGRTVSFRLAQMPTVWGLKLAVRILDDRRFGKRLEDLGLKPEECLRLKALLAEKSGMLLVAGPTGSGKTTTLYSMLEALDKKRLNIVTIEDPVEYRIPGINQTEVTGRGGLDFSGGLRALLRQDPDVILLGEIRDEITAVTAAQAAVTGHLVLSTVHTGRAASAVSRLKNMGVPPYLLASGLKGVLSQRLLGRLCPHCRAPLAKEDQKEFAGLLGEASATLYAARGCEHCGGRGTLGRQAFFELMTVDSELREALFKESSALEALACRRGMRPLDKAVRRAILAGEIDAREGRLVMKDGL